MTSSPRPAPMSPLRLGCTCRKALLGGPELASARGMTEQVVMQLSQFSRTLRAPCLASAGRGTAHPPAVVREVRKCCFLLSAVGGALWDLASVGPQLTGGPAPRASSQALEDLPGRAGGGRWPSLVAFQAASKDPIVPGSF